MATEMIAGSAADLVVGVGLAIVLVLVLPIALLLEYLSPSLRSDPFALPGDALYPYHPNARGYGHYPDCRRRSCLRPLLEHVETKLDYRYTMEPQCPIQGLIGVRRYKGPSTFGG